MVCCTACGILVGVATLLVSLFLYFTWNNDYWKKRGVYYLKPTPFFGNVLDRVLLRKSDFEMDTHLYKQLNGHKIGGYFEGTKPMLMLLDPELIRAVLVKDFDHFVDRRQFDNLHPIMKKMLSVTEGDDWKDFKTYYVSDFHIGKLKSMIELVGGCGEQLVDFLQTYAKSGDSVEVKNCYGRYTMDVISTTAFGLESNSLKNPNSEFVKHASRIQSPATFRMILVVLSATMGSVINPVLRALNIDLIDEKDLMFFADVVKSTIEHREKHGVHRPDFLQLMLDARSGNLAKDEEKLDTFEKEAIIHSSKNHNTEITDDLVVAQCILFFVAGYETTSLLLTFISYELALSPDVQERLRDEILAVLKKHNNKCTYDAINEMPYLDLCIQETLRKNPALSRLERRCTADYTVPGTNIVVPKDNLVVVPAAGLHYDEKYYPNPQKFDPERFNNENKSKRSQYVYMPFGLGPRNCIGMRFALMEAKVGLVHVLSNYRIKVSNKTKIPYKSSPKSGILVPEGGMWLGVEKIN